jgi:Fasciclin domain
VVYCMLSNREFTTCRPDELKLILFNSVLNVPQNASTTAQTAGLTTLVSALSTAKLVEAVDTTPSVTIFAPTNEAFAALGVDLSTLSATELGDILKYHVIAGTVGYSSALQDEQDVETLSGDSVKIIKRDGKIFVNKAEVVQGNVILNNGVVHVINGVSVPNAFGLMICIETLNRRSSTLATRPPLAAPVLLGARLTLPAPLLVLNKATKPTTALRVA